MTSSSVEVKKKNGTVVKDYNPKSKNYRSISEIINNIFNKSERETTTVDVGKTKTDLATYFQKEISYQDQEDVELIKSDPLAYLNKELDTWNTLSADWNAEYDLTDEVNKDQADYYEENVELLERLIKEFKNK